MTEPRRSTRARAREEAVPPPTPEAAETPSKPTAKSLKRKRPAPAARDTSTPAAIAESAKKTPEHALPIRLVDGQPLPTLPTPQPLDLPASEWQDVGQSGVLAASFQRSRAVWISGSNFRLFHANFTPPKKVADRTDQDKQQIQRQKDINRNFPQIGASIEARLVIEPHTFPIRLYGPREFARPPPKKAAPPPQYGQWPNHNAQYPPYHQQPPPYVATQVPYKPPPPPPRPAQPKPPPPQQQQQQQQHTPQSNQKSPPVANTPAPDPVIHMLAQRAGTDPELKSVMKIVAAGQATPAQLQFFQGHINQLTQLLAKQKAQAPAVAPPPSQPPPPGPPPTAPPAQAQQSPHPAPPLQPGPPPAGYPLYQPPPVSRAPQQGPPLPASYPPPQPPQTPQNRPLPPQTPHSRPPPAQIPQSYPPPPLHPQPPYQTPMPPAVHPSYPPFPQQPQPRPPHPNQYTYAQPQHQMDQYNQPSPRTGYRPLIFDFVEGNSDKFYFPSYSFMEWLEGNQGVKISFLITKMKDKPVIKEEKEKEKGMAPPATPAPKANGNGNALPIATPEQVANAAPNTGKPAGISTPNPQPVPGTPAPGAPPNTNPNAPPTAATPNLTPNTNVPHPPNTPRPAPAPATPATPNFTPAPRIEDFDEAKHIDDIAFYRPVTALIYTTNYEILQSLPRAVRPPDDVGRYMEEVIDKCQRDEEGALAFRLPREKGVGEGGAMGLEGAVDAGGCGDEGLGAKRRSVVGGGGGGLGGAGLGGAGGKRGSVVAA